MLRMKNDVENENVSIPNVSVFTFTPVPFPFTFLSRSALQYTNQPDVVFDDFVLADVDMGEAEDGDGEVLAIAVSSEVTLLIFFDFFAVFGSLATLGGFFDLTMGPPLSPPDAALADAFEEVSWLL